MHVICSILLGILILIGITAIPVGLAVLSVKLDNIEPPKWFINIFIFLIICGFLRLAYLIGNSIL